MTKSILAVVICLAWFASFANGQKPTAPKKAGKSYTVSISGAWTKGRQGYQPIRVTIATNPAKAVARDELFTLSIRQKAWRSNAMVTSTPLVIPAGGKSASKEIYVQSNSDQNYQVLVERGSGNGRMDGGDLVEQHLYLTGRDEIYSTLLFISSQCTSPKELQYVVTRNTRGGNGVSVQATQKWQSIPAFGNLHDQLNVGPTNDSTGIASKAIIDSAEWLHAVNPDYLPENWIGLTSAEQILISLADLEAISSQNPRQRSNLEKWTAAGGVLIVMDTGDFASASKVWSALLGQERSFIAEKNLTQWVVPNKDIKELNRLLLPAHMPYWYNENEDAFVNSQTNNDFVTTYKDSKSKPSKIIDIPDNTKFCLGKYISGSIVVVPDDMSQWSRKDWCELHNLLALETRPITKRIGLDSGQYDSGNFEIPGVGQPPVRLFQFLISVFLILAGPVLLLTLRRTQKMQLMFIIIPMLSAVVCLTLFLYVIFADGTQRWGRLQTFTSMDHRTNMAVTHARTCYYSGAAPGQYTYSDETMVYATRDRYSNEIQYRLNQEQVEIGGGKIRPRTPHQLLTIQSRASNKRLVVQPSDSDSIKVQNRLGGLLVAACIRTEEGFYLVKDIADGAAKDCTQVNSNQISKLTESLSLHAKRLAPERVEQIGLANYQYYNESENDGEDSWFMSRLRAEESIESILVEPNTYVAILSDSTIADEQTEDVNYKLEIHVVRGKW